MERWFGQACGNTFLVILPKNQDRESVARHLDNLRRSHSWTFDTALALWPTHDASVAMEVIERDGSVSNMCGNGARVAGKILKLKKKAGTVRTDKGVLSVTATEPDLLSVCLGHIEHAPEFTLSSHAFKTFLVCGEPHAVKIVEDVDKAPLIEWGKTIVPKANCTITSFVSKGVIKARTFERGVDRITQSCGTGACAAAYAMRQFADNSGRLKVLMHKHTLYVDIDQAKVTLTGPAQVKQIA